MKTFYEILGVPVDATQEQIDEACWKGVQTMGRELEGRGRETRTGALREFIMASNVLSNPDDRASYDREIGVAGPSRDEDLDEAGPTSEYEIPMGVRRKQHRHFDIEDGIRLSILRTGGGTLTFTTTASEQVVIKGNPPPFSEVREGELMIAASDYNAEVSLPDHIRYDLVVRSHMGRVTGVVIHEGTIESHGSELDLELGGGLDLDLSGSTDVTPRVVGLKRVEDGLYLAPRQAQTGRTLRIRAVGGSVTVRYSKIEFP